MTTTMHDHQESGEAALSNILNATGESSGGITTPWLRSPTLAHTPTFVRNLPTRYAPYSIFPETMQMRLGILLSPPPNSTLSHDRYVIECIPCCSNTKPCKKSLPTTSAAAKKQNLVHSIGWSAAAEDDFC